MDLKELREKTRLSQAAFAKTIGVSPSAIASIEAGRMKASDRIIDVLNVKCDPLLIGSLRLKPGFYPAYHMNKDKWISIAMDGSVPSEEIKELVELSYQLTRK